MRSSEKPSRVPRIPRIRREYLSRIYHSKFKKKKDKFANILNVCERCERKQKARRSLSAHPFLEAWRRRSGQPFIPYIIYKVDLSLSLSLSPPLLSFFFHCYNLSMDKREFMYDHPECCLQFRGTHEVTDQSYFRSIIYR